MPNKSSQDRSSLTASVIIPAFTFKRWDLLSQAVASVKAQTCPPVELILCIDHNHELFERSKVQWERKASSGEFPITVIENRFEQDQKGKESYVRAHGSQRRFGAGWARNSGAEVASGEVLVFMDDDAHADPDWLEYLLQPYADESTVAVGGAPLPMYETERPRWFPANFDWVFGCAYAGMPKELGTLGRLIGANMSVRRDAFEEVGGFHSIDFDDLDLCMRVASRRPKQKMLFEPRAIVHHFVPAERVAWSYFWRRCFFVNREKVEAFAGMGEAANLKAEQAFVRRALTVQIAVNLRDILSGQWDGASRLGAMVVGVGMAGVGHVVGRVSLRLRGI
jgi:cellulose synthase/poly-beta-1,6-N-acetylglucosamine synthase-like glycosyltransferase